MMTLLRRLAFAALWLAGVAPAMASVSGVVISQVYGGGGNSGAPYTHDFVELYNAGAAPVSLAGWSIQYTSAAGTSWGGQKTNLAGSIAPGRYLLVQMASGGAGGVALPVADVTGATNMSATQGKLALVNGTASLAAVACPSDASIVDLVGYGGATCSEGAPAATLSNTTAALRAASGCTDTDNNAADFTLGSPTPRNSAEPAGSCGVVNLPVVASCPAAVNVATGVATGFSLSATDGDSIVNAAAFQSGNAAGIGLTGLVTASAEGGTAKVTLSLNGSTPDGSYPVVVRFDNNEGQSATCTVNLVIGGSAGAFTPIHQIQGSGNTSAMAGMAVVTQGVVTKVNNNGYYLQDPLGDGNPLTSDGIFVFTGSAPAVSAGQRLQVAATVIEFDTGAGINPITLANTLTELSPVTATLVVGSGSVAPTPITLPVAVAGGLERYEGMLVTINTPLAASQNYFQGRYGQVTLSANLRMPKPTDLYRPGSAAALAQQDLNARSSIMLDDGTSLQNPNPTPYIGADNTLRAGDTVGPGLTGVIDYGLATNNNPGPAMFRIHPTVPPTFTRANPRTAAPAAVGGNIRVGSFNVLNYFTTFGNGSNAQGLSGQVCTQGSDPPSASLCRGADSLAEFTRQRSKIVEAMAAIDADVFGLMEIQNNGNTAAQNLVDALNAKLGAGSYAVVPLPPATGTDAIRVAMIYKPATLTPAGAAMSDASPIHNRPPMAQAFLLGNGQKFSVVVNHFKSKGCDGAAGPDLDQLDGQGCFNDRRRLQAQALLGFVGTVQASSGDTDVLVIGDINAYAQEDPIDTLVGGGLVNQVSRFSPGDYSYVFDGEAGSLDHALATASLSAQATGAAHWHINADEPFIIDYNLEFKQPACPTCGPDYYTPTPYRSSDHDPVIVGLNLVPAAAVQTISFAQPASQPAASTLALSATASSTLPVSLSSLTPIVCTVTGDQATLLVAGTCTIAADQAGNGSWLPAPQEQRSFAVTLAAQSITFNAINTQYAASGSVASGASASSGLAVGLMSLTPAVCGVSGPNITLIVPGACSVRASQAGNATYAAASPVTRNFSVLPGADPGGGGNDTDVPVPAWALALLGGGIATLMLRRRPRLP
jgi:predicted extracellular nuclease